MKKEISNLLCICNVFVNFFSSLKNKQTKKKKQTIIILKKHAGT